MDVSWNGFQDLMESTVLDIAIPQFAVDQERRMGYYRDGEVTEKEIWEPLGRAPTKEEVINIITAVGDLSGKTFGIFRDEILEAPPLIPASMVFNNFGIQGVDGFLTPLGLAKMLLNDAKSPLMMAPPFARNIAMGFVDSIAGIKCVKAGNSFFQGGLDFRGMDVFALLPTGKDIMAAPDLAGADKVKMTPWGTPEDPMQVLDYAAENNNLYMRIAAQEFCAAFDAGVLPPPVAGGIPPPAVDKLRAMTYTADELAAFQEKFSEVIDVLRAALPIMKDLITNAKTNIPPEAHAMVDHGQATFSKITGIEM
jgi:hypothetical protein